MGELGGRDSTSAPSLDPLLPRVGLLHEGRGLLAEGCAYCTRAPPTWSTPDPPPVDPHLRAVDAGVIRSLRATVIRTGPLAAPVAWDPRRPARRSGRGHPARWGTFPRGRGQVTRSGTGLLSPTASNAPARDDTHLAARNVPVGGDGLPDGGAPSSRTHLRAPGLCTRRGRARGLRCVLDDVRARSPVCTEWQEDGGMRRRRIQGSAVRTHGMTGAWPRRTLGPVARTRRCRTTIRCVRDGPLGSATPTQGVAEGRQGAPARDPG